MYAKVTLNQGISYIKYAALVPTESKFRVHLPNSMTTWFLSRKDTWIIYSTHIFRLFHYRFSLIWVYKKRRQYSNMNIRRRCLIFWISYKNTLGGKCNAFKYSRIRWMGTAVQTRGHLCYEFGWNLNGLDS